jgi:hypothetical protein
MTEKLMYPDRIVNVGAAEGCGFECKYCETSFQKILKKFARHGEDITYTPHLHLNRLNKKPVRTKGTQFVTIGLTGDISFVPENAMHQIIDFCRKWKDRTTFMLQSKNPSFFLRYSFPPNVILATTIETNYTEIPAYMYNMSNGYPYSNISKAPPPEERFMSMLGLAVRNSNPLMITMEPILEFQHNAIISWMKAINKNERLIAVNVGYDSSPTVNMLPEPPLEKTEKLIDELRTITEVRRKKLRKAWWELQ